MLRPARTAGALALLLGFPISLPAIGSDQSRTVAIFPVWRAGVIATSVLPPAASRDAGPAPSQPAPPPAGARLPQPPSPRRYGLPVALAVVALVGVSSLLARVVRFDRSRRPTDLDPAGQ